MERKQTASAQRAVAGTARSAKAAEMAVLKAAAKVAAEVAVVAVMGKPGIAASLVPTRSHYATTLRRKKASLLHAPSASRSLAQKGRLIF